MRGGQVTQQDVVEIDFVHPVIVTPQAESLTLKGFFDKATVIDPLDIAFGIDGSNLKFGTFSLLLQRLFFLPRHPQLCLAYLQGVTFFLMQPRFSCGLGCHPITETKVSP